MPTRLFWPPLLLLGLAATGCITTTTVQAVPNKAYIINGSFFGTQVYNCFDASGGPQCVPVIEEAAK